MELGSPRQSIPAILAVLGDGHDWSPIEALLHDLGVLADRVTDRHEALAAFLRRGGHEGLLALGAADAAATSILEALHEIDPDLPSWTIEEPATLTPDQLRTILADTIRLA